MKIIVCLDDNNGMLFNKRRQSRDAKIIEDISTLATNLWISSFSEKLFENVSFQTRIDDLFLSKAGDDEYCFIENEKLFPHLDKIEQLIVYRWNRNYPSDFKIDLNLAEWNLIETLDFVGNSHEKITRETYIK